MDTGFLFPLCDSSEFGLMQLLLFRPYMSSLCFFFLNMKPDTAAQEGSAHHDMVIREFVFQRRRSFQMGDQGG